MIIIYRERRKKKKSERQSIFLKQRTIMSQIEKKSKSS